MERLLILFGGVFSICGAVFDWDFFFRNYRALPVVKLFGREGARKFYIGLGAILIAAAIFI